MTMLVTVNQIIALLVLYFVIKYVCLTADFMVRLAMAFMGDLVDMTKQLR